MSLDNYALPGNILDRILELERQTKWLTDNVAMPVADPGSGDGAITYIEILNQLLEGPDIDLVDSGTHITVGRGGDTILLYDSGGTVLREYAHTDAGLITGLAAMDAGDVLWKPAGTITGGPWTVANGTLCGLSREDSILDGQIILLDGAALANLTVARSETEAGALLSVTIGATGTARVYACNIVIDQNGAGDAYGVYTSGGTLYVYQCLFDVDAAAGDAWCAGGIDDGAIFLIDGLGRATTAPVET